MNSLRVTNGGGFLDHGLSTKVTGLAVDSLEEGPSALVLPDFFTFITVCEERQACLR